VGSRRSGHGAIRSQSHIETTTCRAAQPLAVAETDLFTSLSSSEGLMLGLKDGKQVNSLPTGDELTNSASPIIVGDAVILTTEHGLLAFARPSEAVSKPNYK